MAKTFNFDDFAPRDQQPDKLQHSNCAACEELFTDAIDGLLSPADEVFFTHHLGGCLTCAEAFAEAQRGAAWLDLLKTSRPEPSGALIERILANTSGQFGDVFSHPEVPAELAPFPGNMLPGNVLPFAARPVPVSGFTRFTRIAMEPRLAMTAAMAFFSIALTMNLLGVRLDQMSAENLKPSNLKRSYYEATASGHRYYDNLKVVRVLESRVDDLRQSAADDRTNDRNDRNSAPATPAARKQYQQPEQQKPETPHGSSLREAPLPEGPVLHRTGFEAAPELRRNYLSAASAALRVRKEGGLA